MYKTDPFDIKDSMSYAKDEMLVWRTLELSLHGVSVHMLPSTSNMINDDCFSRQNVCHACQIEAHPSRSFIIPKGERINVTSITPPYTEINTNHTTLIKLGDKLSGEMMS